MQINQAQLFLFWNEEYFTAPFQNIAELRKKSCLNYCHLETSAKIRTRILYSSQVPWKVENKLLGLFTLGGENVVAHGKHFTNTFSKEFSFDSTTRTS